MRVGFDIGPITRARSGVGNYCLHLLRALLDTGDLEISGFAASARALDLAAVGRALPHRKVPVPTRAMYAVWGALGMPAVDTMLGGVDVYHATNFFLPPTRRAKRVLTIHDVGFMKHPELCSPKVIGPFSSRIAGFARAADAVIAVSESTRNDVITLLGANAERVHTVHEAADAMFVPVPRYEAREQVERRYGISGPYVLFVGTIEPRKNVVGILNAFRKLKSVVPHRLVLAGAMGWGLDDMARAFSLDNANMSSAIEALKTEGLSRLALDAADNLRRTVLTNYIDAKDLPALYSAADAFIFPSFYEGFGLPVLEAMACGCPVIAADNSSLPEVGGDAAEYCDAHDVDSIADAMRRVLSHSALREQMRQRGFAQAAKFSWSKTAEQTAAVYRSVCG